MQRAVGVSVVVGVLCGAFLSAAPSVSAAAACTTTCYVSPTGAGTQDGSSAANALKSVQAGVDAVSPGGAVRVLPGSYLESAPGSTLSPASGGGTYQFGVFVGAAKAGITIQGVTAGDVAITDAASVQATIDTQADNNFGPSGVFIEGDSVTVRGVRIGTNFAANGVDHARNKTVEVIGDNFSLFDSVVADGPVSDDPSAGAVYVNDFRADAGTGTSHVQTYHFERNQLLGTVLLLASGAGWTGPVSGRTVLNNTFTQSAADTAHLPSISVRGAGGQPWYVYPVGGFVLCGNTFDNSDPAGSNVRATMDDDYNNAVPNPYYPEGYLTAQFNWTQFFTANTFTHGAMAGPNPPANPTAFALNQYTNVRRIGVSQANEQAIAGPGDTVITRDASSPVASCAVEVAGEVVTAPGAVVLEPHFTG